MKEETPTIITLYLPSFTHEPLGALWNNGWYCSFGFYFLGIHFIKYQTQLSNLL